MIDAKTELRPGRPAGLVAVHEAAHAVAGLITGHAPSLVTLLERRDGGPACFFPAGMPRADFAVIAMAAEQFESCLSRRAVDYSRPSAAEDYRLATEAASECGQALEDLERRAAALVTEASCQAVSVMAELLLQRGRLDASFARELRDAMDLVR